MTDLLDNTLVKRYFGCEKCVHSHEQPCEMAMAFKVLAAMQENIKKGDRYLGYYFSENVIKDEIAPCDNNDPYHPGMLRLPSRFQTPKEVDEMGRPVTWNNFKDLEKSLMNRVEELGQYVAGHIDSKHPLKCSIEDAGLPCSEHKPSQPEKCECDKLICDYCVALGGGPVKPSIGREKCPASEWASFGHTPNCEHLRKPADSDKAVEAKIKELCGRGMIYEYWGPKLRELVSLARGGGKRCKCDSLFKHHSETRCWND